MHPKDLSLLNTISGFIIPYRNLIPGISVFNVAIFKRDTVNVEIFAQYIFSRISRMVLYARKYDVSENLNHYRLEGIRYNMRENMSAPKGHIGLGARKFSYAKISTFTVDTKIQLI